MNLVLNDIAKVKKADIAIDGITVIAGYNGTGKSTISKALYAMLSIQNELKGKILSERWRNIRLLVDNWAIQYMNLSEDATIMDLEFDSRIYKEIHRVGNQLTEDTLIGIVECQKSDFMNISEKSMKRLYNDIISEMNAEPQKYIRLIAQKELDVVFHGQTNTIDKNTQGKIKLAFGDKKSDMVLYDNEVTDIHVHFINSYPIYVASHNVLDNLSYRRIPLLIRTNRLNKTTLENRLICDLIEKRGNVTATEFDEIKTQSIIINDIFKKIVKGYVVMKNGRFEGYNESGTDSKPIDFINLASGIKPFIILKTLLENGNLRRDGLLIYDEPEVNMHPEWQIKFAELIVLLYAELKIKVLINSHSPYFIRAIEFFCDKYRIVNKSNYYFMENHENMSYSKNVKNDLSYIYKTMSEPFSRILF